MKFVAVVLLRADADAATVAGLLPSQLRATWELHLSDDVRSIERIAGRPGAMITFECASEDQVRAHLAALPLETARLVEWSIFAVRPYDGWQQLFVK